MREFLITYHKRDSFFHRLDPLSKLVWALCITALSLSLGNLFPQLILALIIIFLARFFVRIPFSELPIFFQVVFLFSFGFFCLQIFLTKGDIVLFYIKNLPITWEALNNAGNVATRMWVFIGAAVIFVDSTDPQEFALSITQSLRIRFEYSFMIFITLRLISIFEKEISDLRQAYLLRTMGRKLKIRERISIWKLFVSFLLFRGLRRGFILALSMESRAFRAYKDRSYITNAKITKNGKFFSFIVVSLTILGILYFDSVDLFTLLLIS